MIYANWYGGASYAHGDEREQFPSILAAEAALASREALGHWQPQSFVYADRIDSALTPCVDATSYMDLYAHADSDDIFMRLEFGPRGGIRRTRN